MCGWGGGEEISSTGDRGYMKGLKKGYWRGVEKM